MVTIIEFCLMPKPLGESNFNSDYMIYNCNTNNWNTNRSKQIQRETTKDNTTLEKVNHISKPKPTERRGHYCDTKGNNKTQDKGDK